MTDLMIDTYSAKAVANLKALIDRDTIEIAIPKLLNSVGKTLAEFNKEFGWPEGNATMFLMVLFTAIETRPNSKDDCPDDATPEHVYFTWPKPNESLKKYIETILETRMDVL